MASSPIFRRGLPPALVCLFVAACGTQLRDVDRTPSRSLEKVPTSGIAGRVESAARSHPGKSGFAVLEGNREAFADRIALADFAQKTLDVQYYIWSADTAGLMLADHLIQAADRGVRVRFLVDDLELTLKDKPEPKADVNDVSKGAPADKPEPEAQPADDSGDDLDEALPPGGGGNVSVALDEVTLIPGALASGSVTFSDGVTGKWIVDHSGRPGFTEISQPGYRPNPADAQAFMQQLSQALQTKGY